MCQRIPLHYCAIILNNHSLNQATMGDMIANSDEIAPFIPVQ